MCVNLLSLSLSFPGFAFINGSISSKLLIDFTDFLFNDMADTPSLPSTVYQFGFLQGCLCCWSFISVGSSFWLASTAFIFLSILSLLLLVDNFFFPSSVNCSWSNLFLTVSRPPWYLADCKSSTSFFGPQLLLIFLLNKSAVAILNPSSLFESKYAWALSVTSVATSLISSFFSVGLSF